MTQIQIEEVYPKSDVNPMVVNFQNGYITEKFTSQDCTIFNNSKTNSKTLVTEVDGVLYAGDEETEELGKTYILTRNKITGKVRIIESGVVNVKPILNLKEELSTAPLLETSTLELSRKFGSKKSKQQMEQREKLKVNVDTVTEQMQNVTQEISEDTLDLSAYDKTNSDDFYVPPIDRKAESVDGVYDLNKILTEEQYEKIFSELEGKEYQSQMLPVVKNITSKKTLSPKLTVLAVYANSLIQLYNSMVKEISKKGFTACPYSMTLNSLIMNEFMTSSNGRKTRPAPFKDKSLCHAIVFLLLLNNYKIELDTLCEAVKITPSTVSNKVRVTGASVVTTSNKKVVQLKLPLNKSSFRRKSAKF